MRGAAVARQVGAGAGESGPAPEPAPSPPQHRGQDDVQRVLRDHGAARLEVSHTGEWN